MGQFSNPVATHPVQMKLKCPPPHSGATLGENCFVSVQRDCNLKNKGDGTDFKMGVAATLPELSEWTLPYILQGVMNASKTGNTKSFSKTQFMMHRTE